MSYFDDNEDYIIYGQAGKRFAFFSPRRIKKVHYSIEPFEECKDGRFVKRKTACGLEFPQSTGSRQRIVRNKKLVTCKACLKKLT
jgi:hypothetical protein